METKMKDKINLSKSNEIKASTEIEDLLKRYEENVKCINWINETEQIFKRERLIMNDRPHPLSNYDNEKRIFIDQDFARFIRKMYELELDTICENEEILTKISDLKDKINELETPIKEIENTEDLNENNSDDQTILIVDPIPYECCNEIQCICYSELDMEDLKYEEYKYHSNFKIRPQSLIMEQLRQEKEMLTKAYHECLYQKKSLERPLLYWKNKLKELNTRPHISDYKFKQKELKTLIRNYCKDNRPYARKLLKSGKIIVRKIINIEIELEIIETCDQQ